MIKSFEAHNFRCFKKLELSDLRRINVVVGKNATGKTALLELVRLALGATPQVAFTLNQLRGVSFYGGLPLSREQFEAQWNWLFFGFDPNNHVAAKVVDNNSHRAVLRISYDPEKAVTPIPQAGVPSLVTTILPLSFDRIDFSGNASKLLASVHPQGSLTFDQGPELGLATEFFASSWILNSQQNAGWFSQLSLENREGEVVQAIRKEFGYINDLQVLSLGAMQQTAVYATVPFLPNKLPLSLVSAGVTKFFSILSVILFRSHGVVLIDEIENGLHYERLPALWQIMLALARQYDTQIFASTHSNECLQALLSTIKGNESDFMLLRAERDDGSSSIVQFEGREFEAALAKHGEIR